MSLGGEPWAIVDRRLWGTRSIAWVPAPVAQWEEGIKILPGFFAEKH